MPGVNRWTFAMLTFVMPGEVCVTRVACIACRDARMRVA